MHVVYELLACKRIRPDAERNVLYLIDASHQNTNAFLLGIHEEMRMRETRQLFEKRKKSTSHKKPQEETCLIYDRSFVCFYCVVPTLVEAEAMRFIFIASFLSSLTLEQRAYRSF
jgi:hypothetical protein